jgi:uncharacterized protein YndB with AHSA1/START domain
MWNLTHHKQITVSVTVQAPVDKVWEYWTLPEHIEQWNYATDDWRTPWAENNVRPGGKFDYRMEAKNGTRGFDFKGFYETVKPNEAIEYTLADGRKVKVIFTGRAYQTGITETFEAEKTSTPEQQKEGWQSILEHFKKYAEAH